MTTRINGFTIDRNQNLEFEKAEQTLREFADAYARKSSLVDSIVSDGEITSEEIRRDLIDKNGDGISISDFSDDRFLPTTFNQGIEQVRAFNKISSLFASKAEDLTSYITDYHNHLSITEVCGADDDCEDKVISLPFAFRENKEVILGTLKEITQSESYYDQESLTKDFYKSLPSHIRKHPTFIAQAYLVNPHVFEALPKPTRKRILKETPQIALEVIERNPKYIRWTSPETRDDETFLLRAFNINPAIRGYLNREELERLKYAIHANA